MKSQPAEKANPQYVCDNDWKLPPINRADILKSSVDFYGASRIWQQHAGGTQASHVPGQFRCQHGWCVQERQQVDPILLVQEIELAKETTYLVARKDEQDFLRSRDIRAISIGLPYVYANPLPATRLPNSLLVMPAHSLEYTRHQWKFDCYARQIAELRDQFVEIVCCVHPACEKNGYWKSNFEKLGIPCITGADVHDQNGLVRIKTLMNQFEYMTTNVLGSHVVYAAAEGVKVSIFGDYAEYQREDYAKTEFYQRNPNILEPVLKLFSQAFVRERYPQLFCAPIDGKTHVPWAKAELGTDQKLDPVSMAKLFGWDPMTQNRLRLKRFARRLTKPSEKLIKSLLKR